MTHSITFTPPYDASDQALAATIVGTTSVPPPHPGPILTMPPNTPDMATVDLGTGPDTISLLLANLATARNVIAVALDDTIIAGPLTISADNIGQAGGQIFNLHGTWGPGPHKITVIPQPAGRNSVWINAVTYDLMTYVHNGPSLNTNNTGSVDVNVAGTWDLNNLPADWTPPVAVAPLPLPPPGATAIITATVDGVAKTDTLVNLLKGATKTVVLPAGIFQGTGQVPAGVTVSGAGMGKTILDGTGLVPAEQKACLVPQGPGVVVQDMTIQNYAIPASSGANAAAIRDDAGGCAMVRVEVTKCQDGIKPESAVWTLNACNIHGNGAGNAGGGNTHEVYADPGVTQITSTNSDYACGATSTHAFKSRAQSTTIKGGTLTANAQDPNATYAGAVVDIPNGGAVDITATMVLPASAGNRLFFGYGADGLTNGSPIVKLNNSVFVDNTGKGGIIAAQNSGCTIDVTGCTYVGPIAPLLTGWATVTGTIAPASLPPPTPPPGVIPVFPTVMRFAGDDQGNFSTLAFLDQSPTDAGPLFFAGFARPEDKWTFGGFVSYGNGDRGKGLVGLSIYESDQAIYATEWNDTGIPTGAQWVITSESQKGQMQLGQWYHATQTLETVPRANRVWLNAVQGTDMFATSTPLTPDQIPPLPFGPPWPEAPTRITFGAFYSGGPDSHSFNGCLAEWCMVSGVPTASELARHMGGESPLTIWPDRVLGWWKFDRLVGGQVPNEIAGGGSLTLHDAGTAAGHSLPQIVTA